MALAPAKNGRPAAPHAKLCTDCGAAFRCGPGTGATADACWCEALPHLPDIDPAKDCLCPACLNAALATRPPSFKAR